MTSKSPSPPPEIQRQCVFSRTTIDLPADDDAGPRKLSITQVPPDNCGTPKVSVHVVNRSGQSAVVPSIQLRFVPASGTPHGIQCDFDTDLGWNGNRMGFGPPGHPALWAGLLGGVRRVGDPRWQAQRHQQPCAYHVNRRSPMKQVSDIFVTDRKQSPSRELMGWSLRTIELH